MRAAPIRPSAVAAGACAVPAAPLFVGSEVGLLRRVIVHRPGLELLRVTPANKQELLFDEVMWPNRARREHDAFVSALRTHGVEVLLLERLLAETLELPAAREAVLRGALGARSEPPGIIDALRSWLSLLPANELAARLIAGVTAAEVPTALDRSCAPQAFVVPPSPNHLYIRDSSAWAYGGLSVHRMAKPARRQESFHVRAIYDHHPLFAGRAHRRWADDETIEGGDILVIGKGCVLVGVGQRTRWAAVQRYAIELLRAGGARRVIAVPIPDTRSTVHLDTVMTMVDEETFLVHRPLQRVIEGYSIVLRRGRIIIRHEHDLFGALAAALGLRRVRVLASARASSELWTLANNTLALRPGVVLAYEHNAAANACLDRAGIEVVPIPGTELARGHGGPRCMSCPLERDALQV